MNSINPICSVYHKICIVKNCKNIKRLLLYIIFNKLITLFQASFSSDITLFQGSFSGDITLFQGSFDFFGVMIKLSYYKQDCY